MIDPALLNYERIEWVNFDTREIPIWIQNEGKKFYTTFNSHAIEMVRENGLTGAQQSLNSCWHVGSSRELAVMAAAIKEAVDQMMKSNNLLARNIEEVFGATIME